MKTCFVGSKDLKPIAFFDPGLSGAVAVIVDGDAHYVGDLPTMGEGRRVLLNGGEIALLLTRFRVRRAVVENVHAMPGQGVSSMFKFGTAFGQILGVLQAEGIPYEMAEPGKWKRAVGLAGGQKEEARRRAIELFPTMAERLARKKDHNRAEALLLGYWHWQSSRAS